MDKKKAYRALVEKRKACRLCEGLVNPSHSQYDSEEVGSWSMWQGQLDADFMVVAQDWGDTATFEKLKGTDPKTGYPTNSNLVELLESIGINIGLPGEDQEKLLFFTNIILCLKKGSMQAAVTEKWAKICGEHFFTLLADIIRPKAILSLGAYASKAILHLYGVPFNEKMRLEEIMDESPYSLNASTVLFPLYHCGANGVKRNRPIQKQSQDWAKVGSWAKQQGLL